MGPQFCNVSNYNKKTRFLKLLSTYWLGRSFCSLPMAFGINCLSLSLSHTNFFQNTGIILLLSVHHVHITLLAVNCHQWTYNVDIVKLTLECNHSYSNVKACIITMLMVENSHMTTLMQAKQRMEYYPLPQNHDMVKRQ